MDLRSEDLSGLLLIWCHTPRSIGLKPIFKTSMVKLPRAVAEASLILHSAICSKGAVTGQEHCSENERRLPSLWMCSGTRVKSHQTQAHHFYNGNWSAPVLIIFFFIHSTGCLFSFSASIFTHYRTTFYNAILRKWHQSSIAKTSLWCLY